MERVNLNAVDETILAVCVWKADNPVGVIVISHGLNEYIEMYNDTAIIFAKAGYTVVGASHRGHGDLPIDKLGQGNRNTFFMCADDLRVVVDYAQAEYNLPIFMLSYDYGAYLTRFFLLDNSAKISALAMYGVSYISQLMIAENRSMVKKKVSVGKGHLPAKRLHRRLTKRYDIKFNEGISCFLSRDLTYVGRRNLDPKCAYHCSYSYYNSWLRGLKIINNKRSKPYEHRLNIMTMCGTNDYINIKRQRELIGLLRGRGGRVKRIFYGHARNNLLAEINKLDVIGDIITFFNSLSLAPKTLPKS